MMLPFLLFSLLISLAKSTNITFYKDDDYWKELRDITSLYPPDDPALLKKFDAKMSLFENLLDLMALMYNLRTPSPFSDARFSKEKIFLMGDPSVPIVWKSDTLKIMSSISTASNYSFAVGDVRLKNWYKLSRQEMEDKAFIAGYTQNTNYPFVYNFANLKNAEKKECFVNRQNLSRGMSLSECSLTITCFDPHQTRALSKDFKRKLKNTIRAVQSPEYHPDSKALFQNAKFNGDSWKIYVPVLDVSFRRFAWQEAKKRAENPKMFSSIFWQIYESLWVKILPKGTKFFNPERFLKLQRCRSCSYSVANVQDYFLEDLKTSLQNFELQQPHHGRPKRFKYNGEDMVAQYLGPFGASPLSWTVNNSPLYVKRHAFPVKWQSAVFLFPKSQNSPLFKINPDPFIMNILLSIDVFNELVLRWEKEFVEFHKQLPKVMIDIPEDKHLMAQKWRLRHCFSRPLPLYEFEFLLNSTDDRKHLYSYKDAPVTISVLLFTQIKRIQKMFGLPIRFRVTIFVMPNILIALLVKSYHDKIPANLSLFELYSQIND